MKKTKRGNKDHEAFIFEDLKEILNNIFEIEKIEKRTIHRYDITYDMFVSMKALRKGLKGYDFFDFLFQKKVLVAELKTPGQYFGLSVLVQMEDIQASYLSHLKLKKQLKEIELDRTVILTVVTCISDMFIKQCRKRGIIIKGVKGKKGLYVIRRLIDIYIIVIDELDYDEAYVELFKYVTSLKRLLSLIPRMKEGLKKERLKKVLASIFEYKPEILSSGRIKDMIPVFSAEKDRIDYIHRFFKGFGKENVIKQLSPKDIVSHLKPKDIISHLKPKDVLEAFSKKDKEKLKKMLMDE